MSVIRSAAEDRRWCVCAAGVMELVGKALARQDPDQRTVCLGVATWGVIRHRERMEMCPGRRADRRATSQRGGLALAAGLSRGCPVPLPSLPARPRTHACPRTHQSTTPICLPAQSALRFTGAQPVLPYDRRSPCTGSLMSFRLSSYSWSSLV